MGKQIIEICDKTRQDGNFMYKISENKYYVLSAIYHPSNRIFNSYAEKTFLYNLEIVYFSIKNPTINKDIYMEIVQKKN